MTTSRHIKWIIGFFLLLIHFSVLSQDKILDLKKVERIIQKNDFRLTTKKVSPVARRAMQQGEKPGAFKGVSYSYKSNVAVLKPGTKNTLQKNITKNGIIKKDALGTIMFHSDSIYVDPSSDLVLQSAAISKDTLMLFKPKFREVFKDINIPRQQVALNLANTEYTIQGSSVSEKKSGQKYNMIMRFDGVTYQMEQEQKTSHGTTNISFNVTLNGMIGFTNPVIEGKYTKNNGYRLVFKAGEHIDLNIKCDAKLDHKTSIPIWGYDIPAENIGNCKVGVFLVITVDGEINLEVNVDQGINFASGIKGDTFYYFPTSVKYVNNTTSYCNIDYTMSGKIKAFGGIDCIAEMKIKGYDILKLRVRGGIEANVEKTKDKLNLAADMGFRVLIDGEVKEIDKDFTLYDKYFLVWQKRERNFGGYELQVKEADAYYDRVHGTIFHKADSKPYTGSLTLFVSHPNGTERRYPGQTNKDGVFALTGIDLKKGDQVRVKIAASPNKSQPISATIPFKEIVLTDADYYTNTIEGNVSSRINTFPKPTQNTSAQSNNTAAMHSVQNVNKPGVSAARPTTKLNNISFKNALAYKGSVEIIVEPTVHQISKNIPITNTGGNTTGNKNISGFNNQHLKSTGNAAMTGHAKNIQKPHSFTSVINKPFGMFEVRNAKIQPGDKVKARINIDGFILESEWIKADGLVFSTIYDENLEGSIFNKTIEASNSSVIVSALRSDKAPVGKIRLVKGIDMRHSSANVTSVIHDNSNKTDVFKQALHPLVFFDKEIELKPINGPSGGASIANIGPWEITNIYYNPADIASVWTIAGHRFEYVGYTYDNKWTGYKYYQEVCAACNSMNEDKLQKLNDVVQNNEISPGSITNEFNNPVAPAPIKVKMMPNNKIQNNKIQQNKLKIH